MLKTLKRLTIFLLLAVLTLSACTYPGSNVTQPTQVAPDLIYTAAAQTVAAQLTQAASGKVPTVVPPTSLPISTQPPPAPTNTPLPTEPLPTSTPNTPAPTKTPVPPTPNPVPCNQMDFVKDVNYTDNSVVDPSADFTKTWRLRNTGSCTWNSSYVIIFDHGDAMGAPASSLVTNGKVLPGDTVDVSVDMTAPDDAGTYQGFWKLRDGKGSIFGYGDASKAFWVKIIVENQINFDFLAKAKNAEWRNATTALTFGDKNDDTPGVAAYGYDFKMEDGSVFDKVLGTYPEKIDDGIITGLFDTYTVKNGDHFRATLGFRANCNDGKVVFQLYYKQGGSTTLLKEWKKSCDGDLLTVEYNVSSLKGQTVQFMLGVFANGSYHNDKAIWIDPRIQK